MHATRQTCARFTLSCLVLQIAVQPLLSAELDHALFRAIKRRRDDQVSQLLRQGTPVNLRSVNGTTPLMIAALHGSTESVRLLLEYGAEANATNDRGCTALHWAATELDKAQMLLKLGADVNAKSARGNTPLLIAAASPNGNAVVQALLSRGADPSVRNNEGVSALTNAIRAGSVETLQSLFAHADHSDTVDTLVGDDATGLLNETALRGTVKIASFLSDRFTELNGGELPDAGRAFSVALFAQNPGIALHLLDRGANTNGLVRPAKAPALVLAAYNDADSVSVFKALAASGIDVTAQTEAGETALTWARRRGHPDLIKTLIAAGVPDKPDEMPEIPQRNISVHAGNQQQVLTEAATKSISLLQHSGDVFLRKRTSCTACHHHDLPAIAVSWARDRGLPVDHSSLNRIVRRQSARIETFVDQTYQLERPITQSPRGIGFRMWEFSAVGHPPSERTKANIWFLAATQHADGRWSAPSGRPPMGAGDFAATALAVRALQFYPIVGRLDEIDERVERATQWLSESSPPTHQERVFQLLGLSWAGKPARELRHLVDELKSEQKSDGGWSQLPNLQSDAWATGQSLIALHTAGGMPTEDGAYQRGLRFLLNTQFDDGSWFVKSRSFPFQKPFESGFPHGRDQWISAPATAWAAMALTLAIQPVEAILPSHVGTIPSSDSNVAKRDPAAQQSTTPPEDGPRREVSFTRDIQPVLERSCVACHTGEDPQGSLTMTDRSALLRGGETGTAAIVPGLSEDSLLFHAASGGNEDLQMPPTGERDKYPGLTTQELQKLKQWIDDGAPWPKGISLSHDPY